MGYISYYQRTIQHHKVGLKLVIGGTGLGKTSAIPKVVQEAMPITSKSIYIANRHQLLDEMEAKFKPSECRRLLPDLDVVVKTIKQYSLEMEQFLSDSQVEAIARTAQIDMPLVRRVVGELSEIDDYEKITSGRLRDQLDRDARNIVMAAFRSFVQQAPDKYRQVLLDHPVIQSMFPFIAFKRREEVRILLITLHKSFHGFFDGERRINLSDLAEFTIFLDEFDFLENDLIGLICAAPQISNVFRFVEFFYREMERHKLPLPTYPLPGAKKYRNRIIEIAETIKKLQAREIQYPEINQFTRSPDKAHASIFRTSHVVTSTPLYLRQTERAFEILDSLKGKRENGRIFRAQELFNQVGGLSERIITLIKSLEIDFPIIYKEMRRQCYGSTDFDFELQQISYFPRRRKPQLTELDALLEYGYNLYDINQLGQQTDSEEVQLQHYSIYTTPERILETLVTKNLVFALSATADIPRCVHHFDLEWLKHREDINFIPPTNEDIELIDRLNADKTRLRGYTQIRVVHQEPFDSTIAFQRELQLFINAVSKDPDFGADTKEGHIRARVERFFASLLWICQHPEEVSGLSHLMFFISFKQIKLVLTRYGNKASKVFQAIHRASNRFFEVYELSFHNQPFTIVFYNADQARQIRRNPDAERAFNSLFHEGVPVVVVTQYLSAGNGVNLQYLPTPDSQKDRDEVDFLNLHLLDVPYFYFGNPEKVQTIEEQVATLKENIWYQAKLRATRLISESRFKHVLSELHSPTSWNREYQRHLGTRSDALLNNISAMIQALGRVERTRMFTPNQTIVMSSEVSANFRTFLSDEYSYIRSERLPTISYNLRQILEKIAGDIPDFERQRRQAKDSGLPVVNKHTQDRIISLVNQLNKVRSERNTAIRQEWEYLRDTVLRHDYQSEILGQYQCTYQSPLLVDDKVYLNAEDEIIPKHLYNPITDWCWQLNFIYNVITNNPVIRKHFAIHGYEMAFSATRSYFFTPYCYQAILMGAVGEEACKALLRNEHINLESVPHETFEIADLKLADVPYYIDCKNYTDATMARFNLSEDDPCWHPELNARNFVANAQHKWQLLAAHHNNAATKLIYLNLVSQHEAPPEFYDAAFNPARNFQEANIILVRGCLLVNQPSKKHQAFEQIIDNLKRS